jgi:hypothetical protein
MPAPETAPAAPAPPSFAEGALSDKYAALGMRCHTCGMTLLLPGVRWEERRYCCHGCAGRPEPAGALRPPAAERTVGTVRAVHISASPEQVGEFLADIKLLPLYEQKLARLQVTGVGPDGRTACATANGQFGALPYHIELHFQAREGGGYESTLCGPGPIAGLRGTFRVEPAEGGCVVTHTERYQFRGGLAAAWLGRSLMPFIGWTMERELRTLKRLIEEPEVLGEALRTRDPRQIEIDPQVKVWDPRRAGPGWTGLARRAPTPELVLFLAGLGLGALIAGGIRLSRR